MIDLHAHTTASDGEHTPAELFELAKAAGIQHLAVTDHDCVDGLQAAERASSDTGVALVPGIELSVLLHRREIHILGHFLDRRHAGLNELCHQARIERETRMERMVAKLCELGMRVSMEDVRAVAKDGNLGRPHLARLLVQRGYCIDMAQAFDRFLGEGRPANVPRFRLTPEEAVGAIRAAGGAATIAHPGVNKVEEHELRILKNAGLAGIEVHHSDHQPALAEKYLGLARKLDLIPTAGSDFHGARTTPGRALGCASMELTLFESLRARAG